MDGMRYRGYTSGPTSNVRGTRPSMYGRSAGGASPRLGLNVPWGAHFDMGVNVRDAMSRSEALGVRVVDFSREVRSVVVEVEEWGMAGERE